MKSETGLLNRRELHAYCAALTLSLSAWFAPRLTLVWQPTETILLPLENYFCRIKDWRRIATRYDKLARNFLAATALVGAFYWIKL